jgi:hypothetical protein
VGSQSNPWGRVASFGFLLLLPDDETVQKRGGFDLLLSIQVPGFERKDQIPREDVTG